MSPQRAPMPPLPLSGAAARCLYPLMTRGRSERALHAYGRGVGVDGGDGARMPVIAQKELASAANVVQVTT